LSKYDCERCNAFAAYLLEQTEFELKLLSWLATVGGQAQKRLAALEEIKKKHG